MGKILNYELIAVLLCIFISSVVVAGAAPSLPDGYSEMRLITVTNPSSTDGVQVPLIVPYITGMQPDFDDLRFIKADGTSIPYWIENKTDSTSAKVWVKLPANDIKIYMCFDNTDAVAGSSITSTMEFGDTFDDALGSEWTRSWSSGSTVINNSEMVLTGGASDWETQISTNTFTTNTSLMFRLKASSDANYFQMGYADTLPTTSKYAVAWYNGAAQVATASGGSTTVSTRSSMSEYAIWEISRIGTSSVKYIKNNVTVATHTTNIPTDSLKVGFSANTKTLYVDWVAVRKYVAVTPSLSIEAVKPISAKFNADITTGEMPLVVKFTDTSYGEPTSWYWDFGDGSNSTVQNPEHTYTTTGSYTVNLTASTGSDSDSEVKFNYITVLTYGTPSLLDGYSEMRLITVTNPSSTDGVQVSLTVPYSTGMQADFDDLRFIKADGTNIPYWIESKTDSTSAKVWIRLPAGDDKIYMCFGNPTTTAGSNGFATMDLYDDFSVLNTESWNMTSVIVENGYAKIGSDIEGSHELSSVNKFGEGYLAVFRASIASSAASYHTCGFEDVAWGYCWNTPHLAFIYNNINNRTETTSYYGDFHTFEITRKGAGYSSLKVDDSLIITNQSSSSTTTQSVAADTWDANKYTYIDYIYVRKYVTVVPTLTISSSPTSAAFKASTLTGSVPLTITFTDLTNNNPVSWYWDFGDGNNSTVQNPEHVYTERGVYTVLLRVTSALGNDSETKSNYINVTSVPVTADFSTNVTYGVIPTVIAFTDLSSNDPINWLWDFGDGTESSLQSPIHTYSEAGTYTVTLTVNNVDSSDFKTRSEYILVHEPGVPNATFNVDTTNGISPLTVAFSDASPRLPTAWEWDFGDGSTDSTQSPTHVYNTNGLYTVTLTVTNSYGSNTIVKPLYINTYDDGSIYTGHAAGLVYTADQWCCIQKNTSKEYTFGSNQSFTTARWFMNSNEVANTTSNNLSYTFTEPGYYNISVFVENANGNSSMLEYRTRVTRAVATGHVTQSDDKNYNSLMSNVTNLSTGGIMNWAIAPFTDQVGRMFYLVLFCLPFLFIWMQTGKLTIVTTLTLITGSLFIGFIPEAFKTFIAIAIVLSFASAFYRLSRGP